MLEIKTEKLVGTESINLIVEDKEIEARMEALLPVSLDQTLAVDLASKVARAVGQFYLPEKREIAKDIIKEFLRDTPGWLEQMTVIEKTSKSGGFCPGCGLKPKKVQELSDAIKTLL